MNKLFWLLAGAWVLFCGMFWREFLAQIEAIHGFVQEWLDAVAPTPVVAEPMTDGEVAIFFVLVVLSVTVIGSLIRNTLNTPPATTAEQSK